MAKAEDADNEIENGLHMNERAGRPTPKMTSHPEHRKQLAEIERRSWHLWVVSLIITVSLTFGIAIVLYPHLSGHIETFSIHNPDLPQLLGGLLVLVALSGIYIITRQRELSALRNFIVATYMAAAISQETYPLDPLTRLLDRSALPDLLSTETARAERTHSSLCLVLLDIRNFSIINEREGHLVGDLVLKELALTLQRTVRQTDKVLRYGPDQFLCLLMGTPREGAQPFVRRVQKACERVGRLRNLTLDSGIAIFQTGVNAESVVAEAERDLARNIEAPSPVATLGTPPG